MPRRFHKKSRGGCDQCRERRVKCDETCPACIACTTRGLTCTYLKAGSRRLPPATSLSPTSPQFKSLDTVITTGKYDVVHLQLMHKFSTDTYKTLCCDQADMDDWQFLIPKLACTYDFLLHGILALAALHIVATDPTSIQVLTHLDIALHLNGASFSPFSQALNNLTPKNCDAVYAQSAILTVIGIALPQLNAQHRGECFSMIEIMIDVFELLQGASQISQISRPWRQASIFCKYDFWGIQDPGPYPDVAQTIEKLRVLNDSVEIAHSEQHRINQEDIDLLQGCFAKFAHTPHPAPILAWPTYVKRDFVDQLRGRRPFQLLILMHWAALLKEMGAHFWWARGCGQALVIELLGELQEQDKEWYPALQWPQSKLRK
ncbi:hypothetical protein BDW59DRAFT_164611 [Aspergillus cavernicola]|uniref:Zn(2)-C6 fungal-type domain-containing protein n=1 Tax=Aspergillus cavernicola TaxID=176166 RepID=A0ABR4HYZ1_9EURO